MQNLSSYNKINLIFAIIILLIFAYSYVFTPEKNNYPIHSACKIKPCKSTGLSRAFSKIVRLEFVEAKKFNKNSVLVFSFFFIQFFLRIFIIIILQKKLFKDKFVLIFDVLFSLILFVITFNNLIL